MANTLVIKGANFSTNKVTTVIFSSVPCTGISLAESSYSLNGYTPVEIEYTVTPNDTTDIVSWSSSDPSVFTVNNGVISVVGIGTATLTVTCGNYSDTATVTVSLSYAGEWKGAYANAQFNNSFVADSKEYDATYGRIAPMATGAFASEYDIVYTKGTGLDYKTIKIPQNTVSIRVTCTRTADLYTSNSIIWLSDESCGYPNYLNAAKYVSEETDTALKVNGTVTFTVPQGANIFYPQIKIDSNVSPETRTATQEAEYLGINIEFLAS